jgi:hypothetical protein
VNELNEVDEFDGRMSTDTPAALDEKEALRQSIERSEAELRDAVEELTAAVKQDVTLSAYVVERPVTWLAGAFVVGMMFAWRR